MNLLSAENLSKAYGERELFSGLTLGINQGQKIALIARNGSGKSTLLDILAGKHPPDSGQVTYRKGIRVAYLEQEPALDPGLTVAQTLFASDNETVRILGQYEEALKRPEDTKGYQRAFDAMERAQAWDLETRFNQILSRLKLDDPEARVGTLSGGQRRRLALAHTLIDTPDLLLLDEPTNHLDLEMIEWLEDYIRVQDTSLLMVTHDRYFLDRTCTGILELDGGRLNPYPGNYQEYLREKEAREAVAATTAKKTQSLYKQELEWMRKQPKARTTKSKSRIEDFHALKQKALNRPQEREMELEINMERLGTKVVELHNTAVRFGDEPLFQGFSYAFKRGERVGLIGPNGSGKTSLLNLVAGTLEPTAGKVVHGETVQIGYYTQKGLRPDPGKRVIDAVREFGDYIPLKKGRQLSAQQLLERFLFDRKAQYDFIEKLSGGEQKRLMLCTVLIQNPNFLILDEPTNDLDILTLTVLEAFLQDFPGTLLIVSHDRYFMDKITDHLFVFDGKGGIRDFPGNYTDYRLTGFPETESGDAGMEEAPKTQPKTPGSGMRQGKRSYREQREYETLEKEIEALEARKSEIEAAFARPDADGADMDALSIEMAGLLQSLEAKTERWFELAAIEEGG
ncbi:ABC-F family ATP-binding cassette domain-containing protein [Robiginitalea sp. M366]|uniref:ABC-F family ATP-binding cassette domain-containing protein n=1 Tax=Robiginitalea aestuariiviva TaxID=3036903 RepID=UPI00240DBD04|nr:ABC-F family ATP-binding cassette domain-containing protein [Robiginitalea aestuariiviva]MDG1572405.1 ABC-F family ATP-binding cassette domain-containing protein [Robiginitalea aestuariiviva]